MGMIAAHCQGIVREFQSVWRVVTLPSPSRSLHLTAEVLASSVMCVVHSFFFLAMLLQLSFVFGCLIFYIFNEYAFHVIDVT